VLLAGAGGAGAGAPAGGERGDELLQPHGPLTAVRAAAKADAVAFATAVLTDCAEAAAVPPAPRK
jgi:hypothetical protein